MSFGVYRIVKFVWKLDKSCQYIIFYPPSDSDEIAGLELTSSQKNFALVLGLRSPFIASTVFCSRNKSRAAFVSESDSSLDLSKKLFH